MYLILSTETVIFNDLAMRGNMSIINYRLVATVRYLLDCCAYSKHYNGTHIVAKTKKKHIYGISCWA